MTREEAGDILKKWYNLGNEGLTGLTDEDERLGYIDSWFTRQDKEAFLLAINTLYCFDQILWERDIAISQLEELGYSLGEKKKPCIPTRDLFEEELKHFAEEMKKVRPQVVEQEPRWIPVSERLPKAFEFVNCTCHSLIDDREDWVVETVYIPQPTDSPYSDWGNIPMLNEGNCEVVAWMHRDIPQPYKAESEE